MFVKMLCFMIVFRNISWLTVQTPVSITPGGFHNIKTRYGWPISVKKAGKCWYFKPEFSQIINSTLTLCNRRNVICGKSSQFHINKHINSRRGLIQSCRATLVLDANLELFGSVKAQNRPYLWLLGRPLLENWPKHSYNNENTSCQVCSGGCPNNRSYNSLNATLKLAVF